MDALGEGEQRMTDVDSTSRYSPRTHNSEEHQHPSVADLKALERELSRTPLDEIAGLVRQLTYGEMVELASQIAKHTGENPLNVDTLPGTLHRWSTEK
jgi:hypothetical protein